MPRKQDSDTRIHFRAYEDEEHAQKRAWCLHCNKDACSDNIQRMKNHLSKCEVYLSSDGNDAVYSLELDGPIAPNHILATPAATHPDSAPGSSHSMQPATAMTSLPPPINGAIMNHPAASKSTAKDLNNLDKVRHAMGRSTKRMESLEAVLKTQVQDGMQNAAAHVRAAIRDERDRLFKLSQSLVDQERKLRETQSSAGQY